MNTLTEQDFLFVADSLKVEIAALKAVQAVETAGRGGIKIGLALPGGIMDQGMWRISMM